MNRDPYRTPRARVEDPPRASGFLLDRPGFAAQRLAVVPASFFRGPRILLNDHPVKRERGRYSVCDDAGRQVSLQLKQNFVDPVPKVKIGTETIALVPPLAWYQYLWAGLPLVLVFIGGGLGALLGTLATYSNGRILRSTKGAAVKYGLSGLVSLLTVVSFVVLATLVQILIRRYRGHA